MLVGTACSGGGGVGGGGGGVDKCLILFNVYAVMAYFDRNGNKNKWNPIQDAAMVCLPCRFYF